MAYHPHHHHRIVPVAQATAARLPHVWVENVTKRSKMEVQEFHLRKKINGSLNKQFDTAFPDIYKLKGPERRGLMTLELVTAEDREITRRGGKKKKKKKLPQDVFKMAGGFTKQAADFQRHDASSVSLNVVDWLQPPRSQLTLPALPSAKRAKNRHLQKSPNKGRGFKPRKERDLALEAALGLINNYGEKYGGKPDKREGKQKKQKQQSLW